MIAMQGVFNLPPKPETRPDFSFALCPYAAAQALQTSAFMLLTGHTMLLIKQTMLLGQAMHTPPLCKPINEISKSRLIVVVAVRSVKAFLFSLIRKLRFNPIQVRPIKATFRFHRSQPLVMKRLLCVWLPNWPIQRLRSQENNAAPDETGATLLWHEDPRRGRLVAACCPACRKLGVRLGTPVAGATEIAQAVTGGLQVLQHDALADREALDQLANQFAMTICPLVAIESLDDHLWASCALHHPESLLCDIAGIAHLFGGEQGVLDAVRELLKSHRLVARMAIADSVGAAWALAHCAPDRETIAPTGQTMRSIEPLPVESLRLDSSTVATLHRLGIETNAQLFELPRSGLAARLGETLLHRIKQTTGEMDEALVVHRLPAEHSFAMELEYPTSDQEILFDRVRQLLEKARAGLVTCNRGALRLTCHLDLAIHPPLTFEVGLFAPTSDVTHLYGLVTNQIENKRLPSSVVKLTIEINLTGPLRSNQTSLFERDADWTSGGGVSRLVDSLSGRLGRDAVVGVTLCSDPLPEKAFHVESLTGGLKKSPLQQTTKRKRVASQQASSPTSRTTNAPHSNVSVSFLDQSSPRKDVSALEMSRKHVAGRPTVSPHDAMRRPLSLLSRPIPLVVEFDDATGGHQPPDRFRLDGVLYRVVRYWGPERIETGWWKGPAIGRDYYRVETDRGWWWIFRQLASKARAPQTTTAKPHAWMLHGRFT